MGFAANQGRIMALIARKSDLEFQMSILTQHRMFLGMQISRFVGYTTNLSPESAPAKVFTARMERLQHIDKMLEMKLNQLTNQRQAVDTEMQSVKQIVGKNITSSFKLTAG